MFVCVTLEYINPGIENFSLLSSILTIYLAKTISFIFSEL